MTGIVIMDTIGNSDAMAVPGIVVKNHGYLLDEHYFRKHGTNAYYGHVSEEH